MKPIFFALPLLLATTISLTAAHPGTISDEAKVPAYTLPDPLAGADGKPITSANDWPAVRAATLEKFEAHVYGKTPEQARNTKLQSKTTQTIPDFLDGKATLKEITLHLPEQPDGPAIHLLLVIPNKAKQPAPAFLGLNFNGNHTVHPDPRITLSKSWMRPGKDKKGGDNRATEKSRGTAASRWPVEMIIDAGYALVTAYYGDIDPDFDDGWENGFHAVFGKPARDEWGSIATWAWGLSRALDALESDPAIDGKRVSVLGHSRLGKTALWAGASDQRFAITISNNSGCGGAALSRRAFGETVKRINTSFPHWFCDTFNDYNDNEGALPVDQHQIFALIAPRPAYVATATGDQWADTRGQFLSAMHAEPVYQLLGTTGLGVDRQPPPEKPIGDTLGYHLRTGKHDLTPYDWQQYINFADRHLK